jgi:hypothetical protein
MSRVDKQRTTLRIAPILCWSAAGLLSLVGLVLLMTGREAAVTVSGMVRLNGQPLPTGSIRYFPVEGTAGSDGGAVIEEGKYRIPKGLRAGKYKIEIRGLRFPPGQKMPDMIAGELIPMQKPIAFADADNLIREIIPGGNTLDFDLKEARIRP